MPPCPEEQRKSKYEVLMEAKGEIVGSISFSSVIILLVFTPVLFLSGLEGQFFRPLGISYMLALLSSLIVAVTITRCCAICGSRRARTPPRWRAGIPSAPASSSAFTRPYWNSACVFPRRSAPSWRLSPCWPCGWAPLSAPASCLRSMKIATRCSSARYRERPWTKRSAFPAR